MDVTGMEHARQVTGRGAKRAREPWTCRKGAEPAREGRKATGLAGWEPRRLEQTVMGTSKGKGTSWRRAARKAAAEPANGKVEPKAMDGALAQKA